jgi:hypothetical protein
MAGIRSTLDSDPGPVMTNERAGEGAGEELTTEDTEDSE